METLIAKMECSDCKTSFYAKLVESGGRWEIGERIEKLAEGVEVRKQRMLCGDCRGKGGAGDQLQNLIEKQRRDPFGLGI